MTDIEPISDTRLAEYAEWEAAIAEATEENWLMGSLARAALDEALRQDGLALLARLRKAEAERERYKGALETLLVLCGATGDGLEDFEIAAALYYRETGRLRPGKDIPAASSAEDDPTIRRELWNAWVNEKIQAARAALKEPPHG